MVRVVTLAFLATGAWAGEEKCTTLGETVPYDPSYTSFSSAVLTAVRGARLLDGDRHALKVGMPCATDGGLWLQFGVYRGNTIRSLAAYATRTRKSDCVYGFDSFRGLPEKWRDTDKLHQRFAVQGAFDLHARPPFPAGGGIEWVIGLFNETLPGFLNAHAASAISLLHMDADLYSSTATVFREMTARRLVRPGLVIIFDELINYPGYEKHEMLALWELLRNETLAARGKQHLRHDGKVLGVEMLGTSTRFVTEDREVNPNAVAVRLVRVAQG
jgi:hypothetical protein